MEDCDYAKSVSMPEYRCTVRCQSEYKGFRDAIERAALAAENYDQTETLAAPRDIARLIRDMKPRDDASTVEFEPKVAREDVIDALAPFAKIYKYDIGMDEGEKDLYKPLLKHNRAPNLTVADFMKAYQVLIEMGIKF